MGVAAGAPREVSGSRRFAGPKRLLGALSDERLAHRLAHGDHAAFELLYDRHYGGLLGFCRHMLRSHHEAEDAVQHAFIAAYRAISQKGDRPRKVKPWLYAIGRNRCLEIIRSQRNNGASPPEAGGSALEEADAAASGPQDEAEQRHELRALVEDLRRLPEEQRSAIVLAELGGMAHREVADVLECRPDKVRALVYQARTALLEEREARGASCHEVRSRLANMSGGRLRGITRRHVKSCPGCAGYYEEVRRQRRMLALVLPVAPSVGLKENVLAGATGGAASGGASGAGLGAGGALNTGTLGGTATGGGGTVVGAVVGGGTAAGTTGGGGAVAATAGGATVAGSAAGGGAAAGAGAAAGTAAGGAAAGATAGGAFAGGGVLAAITAHAGLTKATAVALAAGSVAVGAEVAKKTDQAEPAGDRARLADARGGGTGTPRHSERRDSPASDSNSNRSESSRRERASRGRDRSDQSTGNRHTARRSSRGSEPGAAGSTPSPASSGSAAAGAPPQHTSSSGSGENSSQGGASQRSTSDQSGGSPLESTRRAVTDGEKPPTPPQAQSAPKQVRSVTDGASQKVEKLKHRP